MAALALAFIAWIWVYGRRGRTSSNDLPIRIIEISPNREVSERRVLWNKLSSREKEIPQLAADYWSDDEIAHELHLSVRTVQNHLQHAREKLHIHSRHELKYFVQQLGGNSKTPPR